LTLQTTRNRSEIVIDNASFRGNAPNGRFRGVQRQSLKRQIKLDRELEALDEGGDPVEGLVPARNWAGGMVHFSQSPIAAARPQSDFNARQIGVGPEKIFHVGE
jgi:hypothetical protein